MSDVSVGRETKSAGRKISCDLNRTVARLLQVYICASGPLCRNDAANALSGCRRSLTIVKDQPG